MSPTEILVVVGGLVVGYWVISRLIGAAGDRSASSPGGLIDSQWIRTHWYEVLGVRPSASVDDIKAAYESKIREYDPERLAGLGPELRSIAFRKSQELNLAYTWALDSAARSTSR